jgi:hypothetical protein
MKKRIFLLVAAFGLVSFSTASVVFAADNTTGEVEFTPGDIIFDPEEQGADPTAKLPTNLDFGAHEIQTTTAEKWYATTDNTGEKNGNNLTTGTIAVRDNRGDATSTWSLKVKQVSQFNLGASTLGNAQLNFKVGTLNNNLGVPPTSNITGNQLTFVLFNQDYDVLTANAGTGAGETKLPIEEFELEIPANTDKKAGQYQTSLIWTFSYAPTTP